ncbi:MAG: hypothetical protein HFJ17_00200 [Clostridia bacterium]|nr:hypothetical protein [Clostridia bacterium]
MIKGLISKIEKNPTLFYAMSIAATWANAGSLLNGVTTAQENGIIPYLLWALGNTLACIVFGIFALKIPKLVDVFDSKIMKIIMGIMCPFQCWISMNGIQTVFSTTPIGKVGGIIIALAFAIFFIVLLYKYGILSNILSDHISWISVYVILFALTGVVLIFSKGNYQILQMGVDQIGVGIKNCLLLIPGAFLYPYYYELLKYNDKNSDGVNKIKIEKAFVLGGFAFGFYLIFIFLMAYAKFGMVANIIKAILVTLISISSLSSFLYSIYLTFGKKIGTGVNILTVILWQLLIPFGVMGAWTLMASIRVYIVAGAIIFAYIWYFKEEYSQKKEIAK